MTSGDNLKEQERTKLHNTIWKIANELRGSVDGWDFKAYVLGFLFYRFISENLVNYINAEERKTGAADFNYAELSDDQAEFGREDTVNDKGFYIKILCECEKRVQIFLYNACSLQHFFLQQDVRRALEFFGYSKSFSLEKMLNILASKMARSQHLDGCKKREHFPHEIGLCLGYPAYDVLEYYKNGGAGCIFSGYWKVYADAEKAAEIFSKYNECKKHFALQIEKGLSLYDLLSA